MVIWMILCVLGGPVVGATVLVYLYESAPELSSWCLDPLARRRWLRQLIRWLFGLAVWLRAMMVVGWVAIIRWLRWLGDHCPPLKILTPPFPGFCCSSSLPWPTGSALAMMRLPPKSGSSARSANLATSNSSD